MQVRYAGVCKGIYWETDNKMEATLRFGTDM